MLINPKQHIYKFTVMTSPYEIHIYTNDEQKALMIKPTLSTTLTKILIDKELKVLS